MICRVDLSVGARLLYVLLDDMARDRGNWFVKQPVLAARMGVSIRQLRDWLAELRTAGHIVSKRTGRSCVFEMGWVTTSGNAVETSVDFRWKTVPRSADSLPSDRHTRADRACHVLGPGTLQQERSTRPPVLSCYGCGGYLQPEQHDNGEVDPVHCGGCRHVHGPDCSQCQPIVDQIEEVRRLLVGYVKECHLPWEAPDDSICQQVLDAAGGLPVLYPWLRTLLRRRRAPSLSYGWFVAVLRKATA